MALGEDPLTGRSYAHRKGWVVERLRVLEGVFAIDIAAYAVMSNHYHLVLRVDPDTARDWDHTEVIARWAQLFSVPSVVERYRDGAQMLEAERDLAAAIVEEWRTRLMDISWFMRALNEHLARRANQEDGCTGRFWEGRFKSQALLDEAAVLSCMSYVDLNPVRAGIAELPEAADYTAIQQRIHALAERSAPLDPEAGVDDTPPSLPHLMALIPAEEDRHPNAIGFTEREYLELVDWAGRCIREDKRGHIPEGAPPILERLGLEPEGFLRHVRGGRSTPHPLVLGRVDHIRALAKQVGRRFLRGLGEASRLYRAIAT